MAKQEEIRATVPRGNVWHTPDIERKAEKHGMKKTEFILMAVDLLYNLDDEVIKTMKARADQLHIPLHDVIENTIIDKLAREKAEGQIYHPEFATITDENGLRLQSGQELMKDLVYYYKHNLK